MFTPDKAYSGFSIDDLAAAKHFYGTQLGMEVEENSMGFLTLQLKSGATVLAYTKPNHVPAEFTILNFEVDDIESAVDDLNARGIVTKIYSDPDLNTDEKGISRGWGPAICWFKDPAGNVLSAMQVS